MKLSKNLHNLSYIIIFSLFIISCGDDYTPKPRGYFRITLPQKSYQTYNTDCPFTFDYPKYAQAKTDKDANTEPCWLNIEYPQFKGKLHLSYKQVKGNPNDFFEDSRNLAYKHTVKADAINENLINKVTDNVYGMLYQVEGNAASSMQFFLTDSTNHFVRGALYFMVPPDNDSLGPVIEFVQQDIYKMIDSFEWK